MFFFLGNWSGDGLKKVPIVGELSATRLDLKGNVHFLYCIIWNLEVPCGKKFSQTLKNSFGPSIDDSPRQGGTKLAVWPSYEEKTTMSENLSRSGICNQSNLGPPGQSILNNVECLGRFPDVTIPRYLNLEPSLAMDWLEIAWDELHIKERVGAGIFLCSY